MSGKVPHELRVKCPGCKAELIVDPITGDVLGRVQAEQRPEDVFDDAVERAKRNEHTREDRFDRLMQSQDGRADRLEEQFDEAKRRAAKKKSDPPPPHPFGQD